MKIICSRNELLTAITGVGRAVSSKSPVPAMEGILFQCEENSLKLTAYDLELGIITYTPADIYEPGDIVINARLLGEILRKSEGESVQIETEPNLMVKINSGATRYSFMGLPSSDFPELPVPDTDSTFSIAGQDVQELISKTIYAVSVSDQKPVHTGSKFIFEDGTLTVVSVDGHRLAVAKKSGLDYMEDKSFIIPAKTLQEVSRLIGDREENVRIGTARRYAVFNLVGYTVVTRLLEGDFLDYKKSIPVSYKTTAVVDTDALADSVERASLIISDRFKSPIKMNFEDGRLSISCSTSTSSVYDEIDCSLEGDPIDIGFNYRYILDALKNAGTPKVIMRLNQPTMPMTIVPVEGDDFLYLVLPVRLRSNE